MKPKPLIALLLAFLLLLGAGCDLGQWTKKNTPAEDLIYVQIVFDNGDKLNGYVKELGVGKDSMVYNGGSTRSYLYDARGSVIGCFNYGRIHYMKVLSTKAP